MIPRKPKGKDYKYKHICTFCGKDGHSSFNCFQKKKPAIKKKLKPMLFESKKAHAQRITTAKKWFKINLPNKDNQWECYLQISDVCPKKLIYGVLQLEHVYPKNKYPELKYIVENIKPACKFCNEIKGSNTLEKLGVIYPKILIMINTPEWKEWFETIKPLIKPELH